MLIVSFILYFVSKSCFTKKKCCKTLFVIKKNTTFGLVIY